MKNLLKNVIRSFKKNKISIIGLVFLLFFGLGVFCIMSNTTANITNEYTSLAQKGDLHDFTASELYEIGDANYEPTAKGVEYVLTGGPIPSVETANAIVFSELEEENKKSINDLYSRKGLPTPSSEEYKYQYCIPVPEIEKIEQGDTPLYRRTYNLILSDYFSSGMYKIFAQNFSDTGEVRFAFSTTATISSSVDLENLYDIVKKWNETPDQITTDDLTTLANINIFGYDYQDFSQFVTKHTQTVFNKMTTSDTPLATHIADNYSDEVDYRFFKSLNVTATKDNIFYKIISSDPNDTIDSMVLFADPDSRYGNELYTPSVCQPFGSNLTITNIDGVAYSPGTIINDGSVSFTIPATYDDAANVSLYSISTLTGLQTGNMYAYAQILMIRFRRMYSGIITYADLIPILKQLSGLDLTAQEYVDQLLGTSDLATAYSNYLSNYTTTESVTSSTNGNVVFSWTISLTPQTCTVSNWTSHFSIVNPQHLEKSDKRVIDPSILNNYKPYNVWHQIMYGSEPTDEINTERAAKWFNTLNTNQFAFWFNPDSIADQTMVYETSYMDEFGETKTITTTMTRAEGDNSWNGIDKKYIIECGGYNQIIWGCGLTPDFVYPVVDLTRPTPNTATECLVYCNDAGYESIHLAFINSATEEFLVGKFKSGVSSARKNKIVDELNQYAAKAMIYQEGTKSVYFAMDASSLLNASGYRVSYIPNLVSVINTVATLLCSFIGILCLIICFVIIKRYVENNRVDIGIMRANGITKGKIAASLLPFALIPSIVGGVGAYIVGLLLQAAALTLFKKYWMLPTPLIGFDWVSFIACVSLPFIIFGLICVFATLIVLRISATELMKPGSEFKTNGFSRIAKKPFKYFGVLTRFRVALAFNSISRLIMLGTMSCLTMSSLVFALTTFDKLSQSRAINSSQFDYSFNLKLTTPTSSGGPYSVYDYNALGLTDGITDEEKTEYMYGPQYVFNTNWDTTDSRYAGYDWQTVDGENNFTSMTKWYALTNPIISWMDPMIESGYYEAVGKNGLLMLPTSSDMNGKDMDLMYLQNKFSTKLTMDYNIGGINIDIINTKITIPSSNPWEIALALMPANSRNIAADSYTQIINEVGKRVYEVQDLFINDPSLQSYISSDYPDCIQASSSQYSTVKALVDEVVAKYGDNKWLNVVETSSTSWLTTTYYWHNSFARFISRNVDAATGQVTYTLNSSGDDMWYTGPFLGTMPVSFSTQFIQFLTTIFNDSELVRMLYPITYGLVPVNWNKDEEEKLDETYTYVTGNLIGLSNRHSFDSHDELTIEGIKEDSQYIKLTDNDGNNLNKLLYDEDYLNNFNVSKNAIPVVINAYAAHKYGLSVGDTLTLNITNSVDRYDQKLHPERGEYTDDYNKKTFKVVGISQGTNGSALYTSQYVANKVVGLPDGYSWNKTHKYMMWTHSSWGTKPESLPGLVDLAGLASTDDVREQQGNSNAEGDNVDIYEFSDGSSNYSPVPLRNTRETKEKLSALNVPIGFNGIYTMNKTGKPITSGVSTYSYTGMYPGSSVYKSNGQSNQFTTILMNGSNLSIAALMSGVDDMIYDDGENTYYQANYNYLTGAIEDTEYKSIIEDHFIPLLIDTFGDTTMITAICGATDVAATDLVYDNLISTFNLAETFVIAIIIPITIIIVAIISNLIINDSKKMTAMLKALGYSDIKNLISILALFIPTMVLGLGLAIPLTLGLTLGYQNIVFSSANILVDVTQKWWYYVAAAGGLGVNLMATYGVGYVTLKCGRLVDQIK